MAVMTGTANGGDGSETMAEKRLSTAATMAIQMWFRRRRYEQRMLLLRTTTARLGCVVADVLLHPLGMSGGDGDRSSRGDEMTVATATSSSSTAAVSRLPYGLPDSWCDFRPNCCNANGHSRTGELATYKGTVLSFRTWKTLRT